MAGKRNAALVPLSHDHHHALVFAMLLRRATNSTAPGARHAFLDFWRDDCRDHFRLEEEVLFPVFADYYNPHHPLLLQALGDHVEIRRRVAALEADEPPSGEQLNELGEALAAHVRLEERELFPMIEEALPPEQLAELGERIADAERAHAERAAVQATA